MFALFAGLFCLRRTHSVFVPKSTSLVIQPSWKMGKFCERQEKARFQGIGDVEFAKYNMNELPPARLSDLAGNSWLALHRDFHYR